MEAAESILRAGYRLDRYELLCPIASGGMATVWLARLRGKRGFEKLFAIKTIRTELVDDHRFQEMFLDEARIASGIQHPNVAQILDLGEQENVLFIVMEWVDGDSLAKVRRIVTKRGHRLPVGVALRMLADACAGLHAAHEMRDDQGELLEIVHRDVSLQNILVGSSGAVKVIDFGIAKAQNRMQGQTRTGVVKGKIHYMAPEQVQKGRSVDRRIDVWALGVCLHELVTGRLPYEDDDDVEVIRKLMTDEAPPAVEGLPEAVVRVLERSLAIDVDARFPTAAGMQRALEAAMKEMGEVTTSEDVAAFLRSELPELAQKRKGVLTRAVDEARDRAAPSGETQVGDADVAFAPTVMSERKSRPPPTRREGGGDPAGDPGAIALTRRKSPVPEALRAAARVSSPLDDEEPLTIPKTSRAWLWITLLLLAGGGAAAYRWPTQARAWLAKVGIGADTSAQALPETSNAVPSAAASVSPSQAPPSAPATVPSMQASSGAPASSRPEPIVTHHTWPVGRDVPSAASASTASTALPSASAAPAASSSAWSPYKPEPAPAASDHADPGAPSP
jgi:serine/threonine protein kinase